VQQDPPRAGPAVSIYSNMTGNTVTGRAQSRMTSHGYAASVAGTQTSNYQPSMSMSNSGGGPGSASIMGYDTASMQEAGMGTPGSHHRPASSIFAKYAGSNRLSKLIGSRKANK
jgi:hypothetical protein